MQTLEWGRIQGLGMQKRRRMLEILEVRAVVTRMYLSSGARRMEPSASDSHGY